MFSFDYVASSPKEIIDLGFDGTTRRHCAMHTLNLGLYHIINAEGLIMLAEHRVATWHCTFEESLRHLYQDFRAWTNANKLACSHRCWKKGHLHMENTQYGNSTFPILVSKAYNARCILAWLSALQSVLSMFFFVTCFLLFSLICFLIFFLWGPMT